MEIKLKIWYFAVIDNANDRAYFLSVLSGQGINHTDIKIDNGI